MTRPEASNPNPDVLARTFATQLINLVLDRSRVSPIVPLESCLDFDTSIAIHEETDSALFALLRRQVLGMGGTIVDLLAKPSDLGLTRKRKILSADYADIRSVPGEILFNLPPDEDGIRPDIIKTIHRTVPNGQDTGFGVSVRYSISADPMQLPVVNDRKDLPWLNP